MNILNIIKKAPKDHVYYCLMNGDCHVEITNDEKYPITVRGISDTGLIGFTEEGKYFTDSEIPGAECVLFPSRDNRDWEAFEREMEGTKETVQYVPVSENGVSSGYYQVVGTTEINLDHEYYKEFPYIDFQIDGEKYRVSTEDIKRLAIGNADNKTEHMSGQSFDGTAEMVSIPDRPMMAAVIMSGMLAGGSKDKGAALVNKALHLADLILDETETKTKEE